MGRAKVLVVAVDAEGLVAALRPLGVVARVAATPTAASSWLDDLGVAAVFSSDASFIADARRRLPDARVVGVGAPTADANAHEWVDGPLDAQLIARVAARAEVERAAPRALDELLGASAPMAKLRATIARAAPTEATVLLRGESGTGKELAARALHAGSARARGPFVDVNAAALPDALLESELFGHEKGAFTGAHARRAGRVELARGGTLFLDEVGDVPLSSQVKLLRLLQERTFERLGGTESAAADVRFVAATHRDLEGMVKRGQFREDLFYRLSVVPIWLPPLRARRGDVPELVRRFVLVLADRHGRPSMVADDDAVAALAQARWPGNVRQLQNFVERLVVLAPGPTITASDVRAELAEGAAVLAETTGTTLGSIDVVVQLSEEVKRAERAAVTRALRHTRGNRALAARLLGVSRATLYNKLEELEIT